MRRIPPGVALPMRLGQARIEYQPLGVVGIVAPWNYPLSLALMPLATAIAAGNRAMIKPSEFTPATSALLVESIGETFPEEQVAVVAGDAAVGAAFSALPFDHLVFTGSTTVGRAVMRAASENLVPVTLELGGKSPVIVSKGHRLDHTAARIAYGKLANAGQTCVAPDTSWSTSWRWRGSSPPMARRLRRSIPRARQVATTPRSSTTGTMPD